MKSRWVWVLSLLLLVACGTHGGTERVTAAAPSGRVSGEGIAEAGARPAPEPGGVGTLTARSDSGEPASISLRKVSVRASQAGDMAEVEIEHVFHSDASVVLEGTFRFPMPDAAILTGLSMWIDDQRMDGELVERDKARKVFEEIVDTMRDPALLEWEHGSTFKMRVFPIEPGKDKIVALRYLVPLQQRPKGWVFVQGTRSPGGAATSRLEIAWQGKSVFAESNVAPDRVIEVPAPAPPRALSETRKDGVYTLVRWQPDWSRVPVDSRPAPVRWIVIVDTSRSALEEQKVAEETLRSVLQGLPPSSRFVVATSDLEVRSDPAGFSTPSEESIAGAVRFVNERTRDGATDLGAALVRAGELAEGQGPAAVVYIGDCEATWGEVRPAKLADVALSSLAGARLYGLVLGSSADMALAELLAERTGGRAVRARRAEDLASFVESLRRPGKELRELEVVANREAMVLAGQGRTLSAGDELLVVMRSDPAKPAPTALAVRAKAGGKPLSFSTPVAASKERFVAARFGSSLVRQLERLERPKEEVVKASLDYQVMSKYTSFLVLESEEAYARYSIERRAKADTSEPRVTGADLESSSDPGAEVSLARVQPGDPEIFVDAPEDAASVRVVFPFGETKQAAYDPEANRGKGAWMVRFLVPRDTPEGTYQARVEIVERDGRAEARSVSYTVDRTAPVLEITVRPAPGRPGWLMLEVSERDPVDEGDLRRVEMRTPSGEVLPLTAIRWGQFVGFFRRDPVNDTGRLRVVGFDQALNHTAVDLELP